MGAYHCYSFLISDCDALRDGTIKLPYPRPELLLNTSSILSDNHSLSSIVDGLILISIPFSQHNTYPDPYTAPLTHTYMQTPIVLYSEVSIQGGFCNPHSLCQ